MSSAHEAGYGTWSTPITSELVVTEEVRLSQVMVDGEDVVWSEGRPSEGGRTQLVRRAPDGTTTDLLPDGYNARTAVHEYGGGAWWLSEGVVWFTHWEDQRLYRLAGAGGEATALTPAPAVPRGDRYADGELAPDGEWIVCVREHHPPDGRGAPDVRNEIVRLRAHEPSEPEVLVTGPDFVSNPRLDHGGHHLCWVEWDHPNMPWDDTRLRVRALEGGEEETVAGLPGESVIEPQWQTDGTLTFLSDRTGWWNLYAWDPGTRAVRPLIELEAEIGEPQWVFGISRYAVLASGQIVFARWRDGFDGVAVRQPDRTLVDLDLPYCAVRSLGLAGGDAVVLVAGAPAQDTSIARITVSESGEVAETQVLRPARDLGRLGVGSDHLSAPVAVTYPSAGGREAHALLYRPSNPEHTAPEGELPPLLIDVHGGPTGSASPELDLDIQFWTSRGFAVMAVNYGGSTGYGRRYRELLRGAWGIVDVEDTIAAARWAAQEGIADAVRLGVRGGSAGGYTTLAVLARAKTPFGAGADYYGVADLEALTLETHKFESRYLDGLVAPYPEGRAVYRERSPIDHIDEFSRPLIVLQGLEDEVVPPNQSAMIVDALKAKGVPVAYVAFEGEQHGFRRAENIRRALDSELSFYAQIFGFDLPPEEGIEPVALG